MQYINVAVDTKTNKINQTFTYTVTPELLPRIRHGVLVEVPFGKKYREGIILDIKRGINSGVRYKLKPAKKIIDPAPIIDPIRLELAEWMSRYYITSLAKVIFFMIPEVAKKVVEQESSKAIEQYSSRVIKQYSNKKSRIVDRGSRVYGLYGNKASRIKNYIQLIQKARTKKRGVILLFPDWQANQVYINTIYERFGNDTVLLDPNKTKTEFFRSWNELRMGEKSIAIGSRNSIFAPVNNLGLIIIDEPEDFGYKEEQTVHYHVREVSRQLAKITSANLVYGSNMPQLPDYYWQKFGKIKLLQYSGIRKNLRILSKIQLIDISQEKSVIGYQLEQKIARALKNKQKVLVFAGRKNQGFLCTDCGFIFRCSRCNTTLQYKNGNLGCTQCNYRQNPPAKCPECNGHNLRSFGLSIESIKKELGKLFPKENIYLIYKNSYKLQVLPRSELCSTTGVTSYKIVIATKEIFRHPNLKFDLVIIPSWEHWQFGGDFNQKQNMFNMVVKLLEITRNKLIIQADNLEDDFLQNLKQANLNNIYGLELQERKKYHYPPFYRLVKFTYKHQDSETAEREMTKLDNKIRKLLSKIEILGPTETIKLRDKFYWQLAIKIPTQEYTSVNKLLINNEGDLQLSRYLIDVDPLQLL